MFGMNGNGGLIFNALFLSLLKIMEINGLLEK
jgi:hypothetical protein